MREKASSVRKCAFPLSLYLLSRLAEGFGSRYSLHGDVSSSHSTRGKQVEYVGCYAAREAIGSFRVVSTAIRNAPNEFRRFSSTCFGSHRKDGGYCVSR